MVIKFRAYTYPKSSHRALLFDYGEFEQGSLKSLESPEVIRSNIEKWASDGRMAIFSSMHSPTHIHAYFNDTPPTKWQTDSLVKPIRSWVSFKTGKLTCLAMPDFLQWTSGEAKSTPPLEFTGEIPPGRYLAEFSLVHPDNLEITAAIEAALGARQHYWLEKFENLFGITACLGMILVSCCGLPLLARMLHEEIYNPSESHFRMR